MLMISYSELAYLITTSRTVETTFLRSFRINIVYENNKRGRLFEAIQVNTIFQNDGRGLLSTVLLVVIRYANSEYDIINMW